jgi:hypothetical protein
MNRLLYFVTAVLLTACAPGLLSCGGDPGEITEGREDRIHITGTVHYLDLEGGFFGIVTVDGKKYDPANLHSEFKDCAKDGVPVEVQAVLLRNMVSIHQWGQLIAIEEISCR